MPILVVQMGHCYRTTGATGTTGEQEFARRVGAACSRLLNERSGWTVRTILADSGSEVGDAFAAIHADGSVNSTAHGASVGYRTPEGQVFGQSWKRAYAARGWDRGFRPDNYTAGLAGYYGVRDAVAVGNRRAIIIEAGFMTNPEDRAAMTSVAGVERVARSIGDALGIGAAPPDKEEDVLPRDVIRIARWEGSNTAWAVTPAGHWHLPNWTTARDFAEKYDLPRKPNGDPIVEAVSRTDWFGPNLTELVSNVDKLVSSVDALTEKQGG